MQGEDVKPTARRRLRQVLLDSVGYTGLREVLHAAVMRRGDMIRCRSAHCLGQSFPWGWTSGAEIRRSMCHAGGATCWEV